MKDLLRRKIFVSIKSLNNNVSYYTYYKKMDDDNEKGKGAKTIERPCLVTKCSSL